MELERHAATLSCVVSGGEPVSLQIAAFVNLSTIARLEQNGAARPTQWPMVCLGAMLLQAQEAMLCLALFVVVFTSVDNRRGLFSPVIHRTSKGVLLTSFPGA